MKVQVDILGPPIPHSLYSLSCRKATLVELEGHRNVGFDQVGSLDARVSVKRGVCPGGST